MIPALGNLWRDRGARITLQEQVASQIRDLIQRGVLSPGDALPSSRDLASKLKVLRNTTVFACDRLASEGYLESVPRSGVFVSSSISLSRHSKWPAADRGAPSRATGQPPGKQPSPKPPLGSPRPFRPCQPDVELFPMLTWNRLRGRVLRRQRRSILHYQTSCVEGLPSLRENVAAYLRDHRGVHRDWRRVVITSGSQQALFILATLLLGPGGLVYGENPNSIQAKLAWRHQGARIVPGPPSRAHRPRRAPHDVYH